MTSLTAALGTVAASWSNWTTAKAICRSAAIWCRPGSNGLCTTDTCGSVESLLTMASIVARSAGESTVPVVETTTSALVPEACGNRAASRFCTRWEGELPESNDSWNRLPMDWPSTVITMMAPIHSNRTRRRWS